MIKPKQKLCKGTGKAQGFGCGNDYKQTTSLQKGLCNKCWPLFLRSSAGDSVLKSAIKTGKKRVEKKIKEEDKKRKDKVTNWSKKLQDEINHIARLIDKGQPCLARGYTNCQFHAGHVWSRGAHSGAKFHLDNIHRQSAQSNKWQNDDHLLREGLKLEYGIEYYQYVEGLKNLLKLKYSNEDYKLFTIKARKIVRRLIKEDKTYSLIERLNLRKEINKEIGIYQ